ncbi:MAG: hypothetical protein A2X64_01710 [Ignavibacteria bacterium GWF2_33_9]|nr:MAG: hypothetical protein A2X64_01710 [Ignavibacteria bacterium GWF2_33_9]
MTDILKKIAKIETLLNEIKKSLAKKDKVFLFDRTDSKKIIIEKNETNDIGLKKEYDNLYKLYESQKFQEIEEFINEKSKDYLKEFCKVNNLSIDTSRVSKPNIVKIIIKWFSQRKQITEGF